MKIEILKNIILDIGEGLKTYAPNSCGTKTGCKNNKYIFDIDPEFAKENNLYKRYEKYPEHIKILEK
jgi:hypothetical protein